MLDLLPWKLPKINNLRMGVLIWVFGVKVLGPWSSVPLILGPLWGRTSWQMWRRGCWPHDGQAAGMMSPLLDSLHFFHSILTQPMGWYCPPAGSFLSLVNLWKHPFGHTHQCVFLICYVSHSLIKWTPKVNHHSKSTLFQSSLLCDFWHISFPFLSILIHCIIMAATSNATNATGQGVQRMFALSSVESASDGSQSTVANELEGS